MSNGHQTARTHSYCGSKNYVCDRYTVRCSNCQERRADLSIRRLLFGSNQLNGLHAINFIYWQKWKYMKFWVSL